MKTFVKKTVVGEKPYPKNGRTAPQFFITNKREFEKEKKQLNYYIIKTQELGSDYVAFPNNILTFNPGWDANAQKVAPFTNVRELQSELRNKGISFIQEADVDSTGPTSFMITDPDGNTILVDQHR